MDHTQSPASNAQVFLIGAGPGDPGLITVKGLACLRAADVVIYDRLIAPELLHEARADAELINVGKTSGHHLVPQEKINALLVERARAGKRVARLKGGDPFVLGRGGEEAEHLMRAGIPFEIIPGVTSAIAVPAYAGIPVTQRGIASSFMVMTGHRAGGRASRSCHYERPDTLVVLMAMENLPGIVADLLESSWARETPAAVIAEGTTPRQQTIVGALGDIVVRAEGMAPPAVLVVGEVVQLREKIQWFDGEAMLDEECNFTEEEFRDSPALAEWRT